MDSIKPWTEQDDLDHIVSDFLSGELR